MNVDCRWWGTSVVRVRTLAAGLALVAAGCLVLGSSSPFHRHGADAAARVPAVANPLSSPALIPVAGSPIEAKLKKESQARSLFAGLPLMFEPNQGQANLDPSDSRVKFVARGAAYSLALGSQGAILTLAHRDVQPAARNGAHKSRQPAPATRIESLQMKLVGASANATIAADEPLPGKSNYLLGNDPAKWRRGVPQFARVRYADVYPGINLVFYGNQGQLEYDFQVAPYADAAQAEIEFGGARKLELRDGALIIEGRNGNVRLEAPQVYQQIAGRRESVEGKFVLRGANRAGFAIGNYDHSRELVIDPLLTFATYFGGSGNELNNYVAVDQSFNIYLAGSTTSTNLPVTAVAGTTVEQATLVGTQNVYIAKILPPAGSNPATLEYVTYLGGNGADNPVGVGADPSGFAYVAGTTSSTNFPVSSTNTFQGSPTLGSPGPHVFVTRLNTTASGLVYSSYLSGSGSDYASGMTIDGQGDIFVTGTTTSTNPSDYANGVEWPVISLPYGQPFQSTPKAPAGIAQFFVTKVNTNSAGPSSIAYSTYFGGGEYETSTPVTTGGGIAVDTSGVIYFTGTTNFIYTGSSSSSDFPILNAYQPCLDQPPTTIIINPQTCSNTSSTSDTDAFVAKLNPNAAAGTGQLGWSTYIGGTGTDSGSQVAVDTGAQNVYVVGTTNSTDIAQSLNTISSAVAFQRCLNSAPPNPNIGSPCPSQSTNPVVADAFVARFPNLTTSTTTTQVLQLGYFSYLGGSSNDEGLAITVDLAGGALLTGWTQSGDFPVLGGLNIQGTYAGDTDAFIARLNASATAQNTAGSWTTFYGGSGYDEGTSIALDPNENAYVAGDTTSPDLQVHLPLPQGGANNGGSDAFVAEIGNVGSLTVSGSLSSATNQNLISAGSQATFVYTITNSGPDPVYNVTLSDDLSKAGITVTFQSATANSGTCTGSATTTLVSCTIPSIQAGGLALVTIVIIPASVGSPNPVQFNGGTITVTSPNNITPASTSVAASMTDYGLSISPPSNSVTAGNTASYQVRLSPQPIYTTSISLSCSGAPSAASCNFTSTSVTLAGSSPGTSTLNITTTARPVFTPGVALQRPRQFYALWLVVPGIAFLGMGSGNRRRRRIAGLMLLCFVCSLILLLPACSHSAVQPPVSGTPAGTYTINVTSTSGSDTRTQSIQLNVN